MRTHARTGRKHKLVNSWENRLCTGKETAKVTNVLHAREDGDAWKSLHWIREKFFPVEVNTQGNNNNACEAYWMLSTVLSPSCLLGLNNSMR